MHMLANQLNADTAALCKFYRSRIAETLEPSGTGVWPHGLLVLQGQGFK